MTTEFSPNFEINGIQVGGDAPTYFIADIGANHDGDLQRAKDLIYRALESGANAAKFQHFTAPTIVSEFGFQNISNIGTHQEKWKESVYSVYDKAALNLDWTSILSEYCNNLGIHFFTSPYSIELVDFVDKFVPAFKVGSGDITWLDIIKKIASKNKPYFLAAGASDAHEVDAAVAVAAENNPNFALLQCNTNYTGASENLSYVNLNVISTFARRYPGLVLGLSDHTPGSTTALGAVALGAKVVEKHFTDDKSRKGPDHFFAMEPQEWRDMVNQVRDLELALGDGVKRVEENELETRVVQRRSIRLKVDLDEGMEIESDHFEFLRPAPNDHLSISRSQEIVGRKLRVPKRQGDYLRESDIA
jgi:N-acetylneuraminate synthase